MTLEELRKPFEELFILVFEVAGEETGNSTYKRVEKILEKEREGLNKAVSEDVSFRFYVALCIMSLLADIHTLPRLEELGPEIVSDYAEKMFQTYLRKSLRKFTAKYGIPTIDRLDIYIGVFDKYKFEKNYGRDFN